MEPGDDCAADYIYVAPLAKGGFGTVSLVVRRSGAFERLYALKRIHQHLLDDGTKEMFLEEGRIAGLLTHANVVAVVDVGEDPDGPYLVMPFVDGLPLSALIQNVVNEGDLLPISIVVQIMQQIGKGLAAAHDLTDHDGVSLGLVHRDVSPQNVLIDFNGTVRLLDFGIAKVLSASDTTKDVLKGKSGYMAPEQLRFEGVTAQTDIYSLGIVMYETLAARRRYESREIMAIADAMFNHPPPDISEVRSDTPKELERLLFEMLARSADNRPKSARLLAERLQDIAHTLYGSGDWTDLGEFMRSEFELERSSREVERSEALVRARARSARTRAMDQEEVSVPVPARSFRARRLVGVLSVALLLLASAMWIVLAKEDTSQAESVDHESEQVSNSPAPPESIPTPTPAVTLEPAADLVVQEAEPTAEPSVAPTTPSAERTRVRRPRRRRSPAPGGGAITMDWW